MAATAADAKAAAAACDKPLYLTFDTGHMGVAALVADVLKRQQVRATFFLANERTLNNGGSLDDEWAAWWRERAGEGHLFGSHTYDHVAWRADRPGGGFDMRPAFGPDAGKTRAFSPAQYCEQLNRSAQRFKAMTGADMAALFRAPGGK